MSPDLTLGVITTVVTGQTPRGGWRLKHPVLGTRETLSTSTGRYLGPYGHETPAPPPRPLLRRTIHGRGRWTGGPEESRVVGETKTLFQHRLGPPTHVATIRSGDDRGGGGLKPVTGRTLSPVPPRLPPSRVRTSVGRRTCWTRGTFRRPPSAWGPTFPIQEVLLGESSVPVELSDRRPEA